MDFPSSVEACIAHALENMNEQYSLDPLYRACMQCDNLQSYRADLWALHHSCYDMLKPSMQLNGQIVSNSMLSFLLAVHTEPVVDDSRSMKDFPLLTIHQKWIHDTTLSIPISRLSQQVVVDLLFGLDWFLLCDVFSPPHTSDLIYQARELFQLIQNRIFFMIQCSSLSKDILDMPHYIHIEKQGLLKKLDTSQLDYASDEEAFHSKQVLMDHDVSGMDNQVAFVNAAFLYDMDTILTHFQQEWYKYDQYSLKPGPSPVPNLSKFRSHLFSWIASLSEKQVLKRRREWQEELQVHSGHKRIHTRLYGCTSQPTASQVIALHNDSLIDLGKCTSLLDLTARHTGEHAQTMMRLATDSIFYHWSQQHQNLGKALLGPWIWRDRIRAVWVASTGHGCCVTAPSYTHAFFILRESLGKDAILMKDVDLSLYDSYYAA